MAGPRAGLRLNKRTGVWYQVARAIDALQPPLVILENVRGLLSAGADSDMEPCPWCLGDESGQHALRALGAVLGDLSNLGYDAVWTTVAAAAAGAPHRRERSSSLPTPRVAATRASRASLTRQGHWSAPSLEQTLELLAGVLPREYQDASEIQGASAGDLLPTPTAQLNAPAPWKPGVQWWLQSRASRNLEAW